MDCLFCKIAKREIGTEKVWEDSDFFAFLDIKPVNPGHTLVIPKSHYRNIFDMPEDVLSKMALAVKKISIAVKDGVEAEGINIAMNNEPASGQIVFHAHFHIIPRYSSDGYKHWVGKPYESDSHMSETLQKIKSVL